MLSVAGNIRIPDKEIEIKSVFSRGPGGQNVNKVATAVQLRFDIGASSLSQSHKDRLRCHKDRRINRDGIVVIKAQRYRSLEHNRRDALDRLHRLIQEALVTRPPRLPTRPPAAASERRLQGKLRRGVLKRGRSLKWSDEE